MPRSSDREFRITGGDAEIFGSRIQNHGRWFGKLWMGKSVEGGWSLQRMAGEVGEELARSCTGRTVGLEENGGEEEQKTGEEEQRKGRSVEEMCGRGGR